MPAQECYHCKAHVTDWSSHDCWTTTEQKLFEDMPEEIVDAFERIRETALGFGEQRNYAAGRCVMFSKKACYCFVRPKPKRLEVVFFLGREVKDKRIRRTDRPSARKVSHVVHVVHRDEVEAPLTNWLREAYEVSESLGLRPTGGAKKKAKAKKKVAKKKTAKKKTKAKRR